MSLITSNSLFQTAASGLEVQKRLEAAAQNIANSRVSSTPGSIGYQIKSVSSKGPEDTDFLNVFQNQLEGPESIIDGSNSANNLGPTSEIVKLQNIGTSMILVTQMQMRMEWFSIRMLIW